MEETNGGPKLIEQDENGEMMVVDPHELSDKNLENSALNEEGLSQPAQKEESQGEQEEEKVVEGVI